MSESKNENKWELAIYISLFVVVVVPRFDSSFLFFFENFFFSTYICNEIWTLLVDYLVLYVFLLGFL